MSSLYCCSFPLHTPPPSQRHAMLFASPMRENIRNIARVSGIHMLFSLLPLNHQYNTGYNPSVMRVYAFKSSIEPALPLQNLFSSSIFVLLFRYVIQFQSLPSPPNLILITDAQAASSPRATPATSITSDAIHPTRHTRQRRLWRW